MKIYTPHLSKFPGVTGRSSYAFFTFLCILFVSITTSAQDNALRFDGVNDKVEIADNNSLDLTTAYTLECWVKPAGFKALAGIISKYTSDASATNPGYILRLSSTAPYTGLDFDNLKTENGILSADTWYHIAAVKIGRDRKLYVNGVEKVLTGTALRVVPNTDKLVLGADYADVANDRHFSGTMDEVRIWNVARTQTEIQQNMDNDIDVATAGLVAYYKMDSGLANKDNQGITQVSDATSNTIHGTAINFSLSGTISNWVRGIGSTLYVDATAAGANTGKSWFNAFNKLSEAIVAAHSSSGVESIQVAAGTYFPTGTQNGTDRSKAFVIARGGLKLSGGYPAGGGSQNFTANPVYLDGNIANSGIYTDNSRHIMVIAGLNAGSDSVLVEGFTFKRGYSVGETGETTYNGVSISNQKGAGMVIHGNANGSKIKINQCVFTDDLANYGGGVYTNSSAPIIQNCRFYANRVTFYGGGLLAENNSPATVVNCLFDHNAAYEGGGGIFAGDATGIRVINCTVTENSADRAGSAGGGFYGDGISELTNCILWNNTPSQVKGNFNVLKYSIIQGGHTGTGNLNADPEFVDAVNGNYQLKSTSPANNKGNTVGIVQLLPALDLAGTPRILGNAIDIGAYEDPAQANFITRWDLSKTGSGNTQLFFEIRTTGPINYSWKEVSPGNSLGQGTINGGDYMLITSLPSGSIVDLSISPTNFTVIYLANSVDGVRLTDVLQWGSISWKGMISAFANCRNLDISASDIPDLRNTSSLAGMFVNCTSLTGPTNINSWNVSKATKMNQMFFGAEKFNQNIDAWDVSNVTDISQMFNGATNFNQNIGAWNVSNVTKMERIFANTSSFNQNINSWNLSKVTDLSGAFNHATAFNQPVDNWDVSHVVDMGFVFNFATSFNQNIESWDVANATSMSSMFFRASAFNQSLAAWASKLKVNVDLSSFISYSGIQVANYDAILNAFNASGPAGRTMGAAGLNYCSAATARANLVLPVATGGKGWTISDDLYSCALPVTLVSFSGKRTSENQNTLKWVTVDEKDFDRFEIERSADARSFEKIGIVDHSEGHGAKGQESSLNAYTFTDQNAGTFHYYRLKMIDVDNTYEYSRLVSTENSPEKAVVGTFYPNPSNGKVFVDVFSVENKRWKITTLDLNGRMIRSETRDLQKGLNKIAFENAPPGLNLVRFSNDEFNEIRKLITD